MLSKVLLYNKDYTPPPPPPEDYEGEAFLQRQEDNLKKLLAHMRENANKPKRDEEIPLADDFEAACFGNPRGNEVVLPCPEKVFLKLLKRCTAYAKAIRGQIKLVRSEKTLILFIIAPFLCLNRSCMPMFLELLLYTFNIDFYGYGFDETVLRLQFDDIGPDTKTLDLEAFQNLIAQLNEK